MRGVLVMTAAWFGLGCGNTAVGPYSERPLADGQGRLAVELVDAPFQQAKEINVTISRVTAHSTEKGWVQLFKGNLTIDLLKLKTYALPLGFANLPPGKVTQLRLYVDEQAQNEVVLPSGERPLLKVPSGVQSGIKIKGPFGINACQTTGVTLDFVGHKSIWYHPTGQGEPWILRPVIHTKKVASHPSPCGPGGQGGGSGSAGGAGGSGGTGGAGGGGGIIEGNPGVPVGSGSPCTVAAECLTNVCVNGVCGKGGPGIPCQIGKDCISGTCTADGTCSPGGAGGTGTGCAVNTDCLSNSCTKGACDPGDQGAPCNEQKDCHDGYTCASNTCIPLIN